MFGMSFSELLLVSLVAVLVLGPERLPGAARTAGHWIGRLKRSFRAIQQEVEREIGAEEIRRQLSVGHANAIDESDSIMGTLETAIPANEQATKLAHDQTHDGTPIPNTQSDLRTFAAHQGSIMGAPVALGLGRASDEATENSISQIPEPPQAAVPAKSLDAND